MTAQRSESFVPLTAAPAPPAAREFRVIVQPGAAKGKTFHALESTPAAATADLGKKICEPRVTVQRDGNTVTHLRIQCTCGQIMDLACVYDPPTPAA